MTRVDFYILQQQGNEARQRFVCRLIEKARRHGSRVFVAVENAEQASLLDELLWTHAPESFIPHIVMAPGNETLYEQSPTLIGADDECADHHDILINLRSEIPSFFSRFQRLAEIVVQDTEVLDRTRANWKYYRDRGYPLHRHSIS